MGAYDNSNREVENLKVKLVEVLDKLGQRNKLLQELQSEQNSLADWVRDLERTIQRLPQSRDDSASSAAIGQGGVANHFQECSVYISPIGHPASDALKG